jgi:hypothetical protein
MGVSQTLQMAARNWRKLAIGTTMAGVAAGAFCWGRVGSMPHATAAPPTAARGQKDAAPPAVNQPPSDYSKRVVANIYGTEYVTREELGEYLIARYGADKLELLVNRRIIDAACREQKIECTDAEVNAQVHEAMKGAQGIVSPAEFEQKVLKPRHLNMYEWREDVLRPKVLMTKYCRHLVSVTEDDIQKAYEAYYGEKVQCRIIMWPAKDKPKIQTEVYGKIRASEEEFQHAARSQASPTLASAGGRIDPPVGRHTTGDERFEKTLFSLRPGEVSELFETGDQVAVVKVDARIPPNSAKRLEEVRADLEKEVLDKKVQAEFPRVFEELKKKAAPKLFLGRHETPEQIVRDAGVELEKAAKPNGN